MKDLDYKTLGEQLEPNKDIIAINSNFIHKTYEGFENSIAQPKNIWVIDEDYQSGELSVQTFITYLKESNGLESVEIIKSSLSLLNFKYHMILPSNLQVDISKLDSILTSDLYPPPFKIVYKADPIESIRKLSIIFESNGKKTCVIILPSGKINIMSATSYDDALKIYNFLGEIFESEVSNLLAIVPTCAPPKPKTPGKRGCKKIN
ncbi:3706_t:CDS:2 [Entrophospora sp. SA101]|nr:12900_t:CDS:2 [Entrophospora sp. SA101]CAJ0838017.1 3706_t:CDS:2 [Entrophospora sp. SA101]